MIKNIFFDLDGTLLNTEEGILEGIKLMLTHYGYDIPEYAVLRKTIGPPFAYSFPNILHIKDTDYENCVKDYRSYYDNGGLFKSSPYDGVEDMLKALINQGYSLNVCSSKPEPACRKLLTKIGFDKYFSDIVGSTLDGSIDKKEDVIAECFRRAPWKSKDETVLIGDTTFDVIGAKNAGIDCIGISWGFGEKNELLENGAIVVLDNTSEVLEYIEKN